ncbi:acetyltransferase family protein [Bifidobacterium biavatii DSM 23969]|uniref:Acetyltransferase family protein n=2 Tax=Bifidobacterium biavatii TaxID=762212 RepID=A0A086ZSE9_9BIFI|nr:acetyltransferase family protein [Bifidobacterium biavatii DSM 23969]
MASQQTLFHGKAQAYADARPGYPDAAIAYIGSLIPDGSVVADIGAGTGKFTVPIARYGFDHHYDVHAVEPDADMRGVLLDATRPYANVTVAAGTAEHTTLPDHSVDAIVCAQALHWFNHDAFLAECRRISRGDRFLLVSIYNSTSFDSAMMRGADRGVPGATSDGGAAGSIDATRAAGDSAPQSSEAIAISPGAADARVAQSSAALAAVSPEDAADIGVSARHFRETAAEFFDHPTIRRFPNPIRYTRDTWRTYMDSHSHSPLPDDPAYPAHRAWVDAIFDKRAVDGIMIDDNVTMIASELLPAMPERGRGDDAAVTIRSYSAMPSVAREIRERVFVRERKWRPEFDGWDELGHATHLLAFDGGQAVGTCRFYTDPDHADSQPGRYVIARLAVLPDERGRRIGSALLSEAERRIALAGGTLAAVHAEDDRYAFYERRGYQLTDDIYEGGRHGWLIKRLL